MRYLFFFLIHFCFSENKATAATYYINSIEGNDSYSGKDARNAWRSLERLNETSFKPGDTILFKAGRIYEGQWTPKGSGSSQQPIHVGKFGEGYKPRLQGNGVMPATVYLYNVEGWELTDLDISNYGPERQANRTGVLVELKDYGVAKYIKLKNIDIHDVNGSLIKKEGGGAGVIFQNGGREIISSFDGLYIEGCTVKRTHRNGILINGYWNRQDWNPNRNVIIKNNLIEGVPGDGIVPTGCDGALIEGNVMRDSPRLLPDSEAAAGIWPWSSDNTVIQYNEVSDHKAPWDAQGFDSDWNCKNTIIQYNYSHDNEGGFLLVCNDGGVGEEYSVGNDGTIIRYNISINDGSRIAGKHAGFSPVIHLPGPTKNTKIHNNVIIVPASRPIDADSTLIEFDNWGGYPTNTLITENIFYSLSPSDYVLSKAQGVTYKSNQYYGLHSNKPETADVSQGEENSALWKRFKDVLLIDDKTNEKAATLIDRALKDYFNGN